MAEPARCTACEHLPHPGRRCRVQRVTGPPSTGGHAYGHPDPETGLPALYDHGGRTVTQCECNIYTPELNGAPHD